MSKITVTGIEARDQAIKGANFLADCVKATLGPWGLNAALEKGNKITNDGVTIASEVEVKDEIEQRGLTILREACLKVVAEVGDGTTSALVLAQAILKECVRFLGTDRTFKGRKTAIDVINTIEKERKEITEKLVAMATPIETEEQLIASARVSVEDETLASLIGKAQFDIGKEGIILVEETNDRESSLDRVNGIRIDNGIAIPGLMNNLEKQCVEVKEGARIILTNMIFQDLLGIQNLGKTLAASGVRDLILVGRAFGRNAIRDISENIKGGFNIYPVNAPYTDQNEIMLDLSALTGARFIDEEQNNFDDIMVSDVGYVQNFIGRRYDSIFSGKDDEKAEKRVAARLVELTDKLAGEASEFEKRNLNARIAQFKKGFGILKVGGTSDVTRKYMRDKADDAVNAVRAAFQEGVVPGAGLALKRIADELPETYMLKRPITAIYDQIMSTAPSDFIVPEWVKDPVKVQRIVLEKACSVAGTLATISTVIATEKEKPRYVQETKTPSGEKEGE